MSHKKILFIDLDGVLLDFGAAVTEFFRLNPHLEEKYGRNVDQIPGIFRYLKPIQGAQQAIKKLYESGKYDMFVATTAPWRNPESATDKRYSIEKYFSSIFYKRMIITHRKDLLRGDILIDDRLKNGVENFNGKVIHFGWDYENKKWNEYPDWDSVLNELL